MGLFPEKEPKPKGVEHAVEDISPLTIERKEVVTPRVSKFTAQVTDDQGNPIIKTPENREITVSIPALNEDELKSESKGKQDVSRTWNASFLLRIIKKALHFGKKIVFNKK